MTILTKKSRLSPANMEGGGDELPSKGRLGGGGLPSCKGVGRQAKRVVEEGFWGGQLKGRY